MEIPVKSYTTESVLTSLGYSDPLVAARQQARMILLGRRARYQTAIQQLEAQWGCTLAEMRVGYSGLTGCGWRRPERISGRGVRRGRPRWGAGATSGCGGAVAAK